MSVNDYVLVQGMRDTRSALSAELVVSGLCSDCR
jgi:hypothetical protein